MKSCSSCPSFCGRSEATVTFKRDNNSDVCIRFGHVLSRQSLDEKATENMRQSFASECPGYGLPRDSDKPPHFIEARVTAPDPEVLAAGATGKEVPSCKSCKNLVSSSAVYQEFEWSTDLCAATGRLIFRPNEDCKGCPFADPGRMRTTTDGLYLRPEYTPDFQLPVAAAVGAYVGLSGSDIEPSEYPTDQPVSEEDTRHGIRAWRRVEDPHGTGHSVMLPIFNLNHFTEEQRALVPQTGDDEHPELYVDYSGLIYSLAVEWMELDETPAIFGPPGVGKTEGLRHTAWMMQAPFRRLSFNAESDPDDVIGKWVFADGETRFLEGRLTKGWRETGVDCLDEPNTAPDSVWQVIRPLTDNSKQLVLDTATGQSVTRDPYCFPAMAMNPPWDARNIGTRELADADGNRLASIFIGMPPEPVERYILTERCKIDGYDLPAKILNMLIKIAADIREAADPEHGHLPITWGLRPQIAVARKTRWYSLEMAYRRAITDRLEPQTSEEILQFVRDHNGEKSSS